MIRGDNLGCGLTACNTPFLSFTIRMGVDQRAGEGSNPLLTLVVSKSDRNHGTATTPHRTLGLTHAGTNLSLGFYPILIINGVILCLNCVSYVCGGHQMFT